MAKAILICGKICCGKSTYAKELRKKYNAVILSADEITLSMFGQHMGEKHDEYCENLRNYLFKKSLELLELDINVILDWGFWHKDKREFAREFYGSRNIDCEIHYLNISDDLWRERLEKRNREIKEGKALAYYVDDNLAQKFYRCFDPPEKNEIDVWVECSGY